MDVGRLKWFIKKLGNWEYFCLSLLVIINLVIHFAIINNPPQIVFDEKYYVNDARLITDNHTTERTEHPPLGKLLVTSGVVLFGDNPFGWRFFSVIFGTFNIMLFYLICRNLKMSVRASNIAVFLLTFENLSFVQGGLAMLDVFSLTFTLLSFWLYLRQNYPLSALAAALAVLVKLTGVFALLVICLHWIIVRRKRTIYFATSLLLAPLGFLLLMPAFEFIIYRRLVDFIYYTKLMLTQSAGLIFATVNHPEVIRPWTMVIIPKIMAYYYGPHYFAAISFTIWALIIPAFIYMIIRAVKKNEAGIFGVLWFSGTFLVWIPISLLTDRVSYLYYFYPTVGAVCLGIGMGLSQMIDFWRSRQTGKLRWAAISGVVVFLLLHLAVFVILAPVNPWAIEKWLR